MKEKKEGEEALGAAGGNGRGQEKEETEPRKKDAGQGPQPHAHDKPLCSVGPSVKEADD
jgi:hypothetical protein